MLGGARGRRELSGMIIKAYKADFCSDLGHTLRMSAFGGRTDIFGCGSKSPLIAMCGRLPVGKGFFDGDTELVGAAMCPACLCGTVTWPLAIMLSADQVPIKSTQSRRCNG